MKVTLVQAPLAWQDRAKNLGLFSQLLSDPVKSDLVILPEMFSTGFTMQPEKFAEADKGESFQWMKKTAQQLGSVITGSVAVNEQGKYYNRLYWVTPNGSYTWYDKKHLFRMGKEDEHYTAGDKKTVCELKGWKICPLICYDLRFPVWSRNRFDRKNKTWEYDVLIYVANWPEVRSGAWKSLLVARAIENQCYVIGVNRVGKDGNDVDHSGDSMVISPKGEILLHLDKQSERPVSFDLDRSALVEFRKNFPVGMDADDFSF